MRKRQFTPTVDGRLEDRVVLSSVGGAYYAPVAVSQRAVNNALNRMHDAFVRAMNDFNKEYRAVVGNYNWYYANNQLNGAGIARLQRAAIRVGNQLGADLAAAVHGLPYARRDLSPYLNQIGKSVGQEIASYYSYSQMATSGRTAFQPGWVEAKCFVIDTLYGNYVPVNSRT